MRSPLVLTTEESSENVGEASSVSGRPPVDATKEDVAGADDVTSEAKVGEASSVSGRRPVEATKVDSAGVVGLAVEEAIVGETSSVVGRAPVDATKVELAGADELALEGAVGWGSFEGTPPDEAAEGLAELASDAVGNTISSLLGRLAEGRLEGRSLRLDSI